MKHTQAERDILHVIAQYKGDWVSERIIFNSLTQGNDILRVALDNLVKSKVIEWITENKLTKYRKL